MVAKPNNPAPITGGGENGGICTPGNFCKGVNPNPYYLSCTAGQYCSNFGLADTEGQCREGYYCAAG